LFKVEIFKEKNYFSEKEKRLKRVANAT